MTLPQHLDPFLMQDNPSLTLALHMADAKYELLSGGAEGGFADVLLGIIARESCQMYCDNILGVCEFGPAACKQLATDIGESDSPSLKFILNLFHFILIPCIMHPLLFCTMTNKCTIISQIITLLHVWALLVIVRK
jgi:hypothetical protein